MIQEGKWAKARSQMFIGKAPQKHHDKLNAEHPKACAEKPLLNIKAKKDL